MLNYTKKYFNFEDFVNVYFEVVNDMFILLCVRIDDHEIVKINVNHPMSWKKLRQILNIYFD